MEMTEKKLEQQRCQNVIKLLQTTLKDMENTNDELLSQAKHVLSETANFQIKDGNDTALFESSVEVQQHEKELLLYEHQMQYLAKKQKLYRYMLDKPYFGRLDFVDDTNQLTTIYLGISDFEKNDINYVTDWRTPITSLFYNGKLGLQTYQVENNNYQVDVRLKRQFLIEHGQIEVMQDTSQVITDEVLLTVLSNQASAKMQQIVATIQAEQNDIIRDMQHKYLLINGVAGSGKTSVLMQRIAYLVYQKRQFLSVDDCLMIAPNKVFSRYVSDVLPSLGEEDIYRYDADKFIQQIAFSHIEEWQHARYAELRQQLKTLPNLLRFKQIIENIKQPVFKPIYLSKHEQIITVKKLQNLWSQLDSSMQTSQKMQILQQHLAKQLQKIKYQYAHSAEMEERLELEGSELYENLMQANASLSIDEIKEEIATQLAEEKFQLAEKNINNFNFINYPKQYLSILQQVMPHEQIQDYKKDFVKEFKDRTMCFVDFCLYTIMKKMMMNVPVKHVYKEIFIDEVQDVEPVFLMLLKTLYPNANFTMAGDLNQSFNNAETISRLQEIINLDLYEIRLTKSYRNTKEISQFANAIIPTRVQTVNRDGVKPEIIVTADQIATIQKTIKHKQRVAIITRTAQKAQIVAEELSAMNAHLVTNQNSNLDANLLVLPIELAKGLEFDVVILLETDNILLGNELYTMVTRAMHELYVVAQKQPKWLNKVDSKLYQLIIE